MTAPYWLRSDSIEFPPANMAAEDPPGLLAVGGDLSCERLLAAYSSGIFPWFGEDSPILWWSPDPRMVLRPGEVHVSQSMRKLIRQQRFSNTPLKVTMDDDFTKVMQQCGAVRERNEGTWITASMQAAYLRLHALGHAHSLEVTQNGKLLGGLYGVSLGRMFFGESMFSLAPNASKLAFIALCHQLHSWNYRLVDCQLPTEHLTSLGARTMSREDFMVELASGRSEVPDSAALAGKWTFDEAVLAEI
ncbi:MAG: leucyl/phenylalanyl-tRNA--protein transferase [Pseudohongiella sp.]|nr:leucyl/phenylalanyl-tRNA--protein transferase [Pseudohongiella sp.]MDO9519657.1 leucyl/phenylalanyl-tRNA--protein transferase [Pseudohongiella sp.]MDP2127648.1 leucyl/phenylalanyl-tRNA--protein transferase [Pseudohongiella sp.]